MNKQQSLHLREKAYASYMDAERKARNKQADQAFLKCTQTPDKQSEHLDSRKPPKVGTNWRQQSAYQLAGRLSIYSILYEENPSPLLISCLENLLIELYGHLPGFSDLSLPDFLKRWQVVAKEQPENFALSHVTYPNPVEQKIFYKMLRGCSYYDTEKRLGYPPLNDFVCLDKTKSPIPWRSARAPLLRAVFQDLADTILALEALHLKKRPQDAQTLSWNELQRLLNERQIDVSEIAPLLSHARGKSCKKILATDSNQWTQVRH